MQAPTSNYVVLFTPRTGSTFLMRHLNSHHQIVCWGEFMSRKHAALYRDHGVPQVFRDVFRVMGPIRHTGGKVAYHHHDRERFQRQAWSLLVNMRDVKIVHLSRRNKLLQFISRTFKRTGGPSKLNHTSGRTDRKLVLSPEKFVLFAQATEDSHSFFRDSMRLHESLHVEYEQLQQDSRSTVDLVTDFIGANRYPTSTNLIKINNRKPCDCIENWDEFSGRISNTKWAWCLDD